MVVNGFLLFLWLTLPLTYPGEAVFHIGSIGVSHAGIVLALLITMKSNAIILVGIALLSTTYLTDTGRALGRLRVPDKIIHILLFMLRYLSVMSREYVWLTTAMKMRCFEPKTNLRTYRSYANMVGMLLIGSYERAEAIHAAMLCRGFKGKFYTTDDFSIQSADVAFGAVLTILLVFMGILQWAHLLT
jgi:cobalt/nickel transport system permease protein